MLDLDAIEAVEKAMTPGPWERRDVRDCGDDIFTVSQPALRIANTYGSDKLNATGIALLRNAAPEMTRRIREQDAEIKRLERQLELERGERREKDIAAACDHLHETIARLRATCGEADHLIGLLDYYNNYHPDRMKFRAASKGEQ